MKNSTRALARIRIGTCQFAVSKDAALNRRTIVALIEEAHEKGAQAVLFPECALSGYPGHDGLESSSLDWDLIGHELAEIQRESAAHGIWTLLGSARRLSTRGK